MAQNLITKNVVVELREKNSNQKTYGSGAILADGSSPNGDYTVSLPREVDLEEGDVVSVSSVFLDDDGENDNAIVLAEDTPITMSGYIYHQDNNTSQTEDNTTSAGRVGGQTLGDARTYHPAFQQADAAQRVHPDGQLYFLSSIDDAVANGQSCNQFSVQINMLLNRGSPVPVFFKYVNSAGQTIKKVVAWDYETINKIQSAQGVLIVSNELMRKANTTSADSFSFPFDFQQGTLQFDVTEQSAKDMARGGVLYPAGLTIDSDPQAAGHKCSLIQKSVSFTLKAGSYKPEHISQLVTDQIVRLSSTGFITGQSPQRFTNNEFFTTSLDLKEIGDKADGTRNGTIPFFIRADGARALQFSDTDIGGGVRRNYWCGASNFGLSYDGIRFGFTNLHNSIYHRNTPVILGTQVGNRASTNSQYLANKVGGICFSQLEPADFWFTKLGFRRDMLVHPKKVTCAWVLPGGHPGATQNPVGNVAFTAAADVDDFDNRIIEGVHATGDLNDVDALVVKNDEADAARGNGAYDIPGNDGLKGVNTTVMHTVSILAGELNQIESGRAYYQVEIDMNIPSEKLGSNEFNNKVQAIVGRYYSSENGTQSMGGEGAIVYTHKGSPIKLNQFRVRILDPDGTLASLGDDNTVFLQITKAK